MIDTKFVYYAFGLTIESAISLPELPHTGEKSPVDVSIKTGDLSTIWSQYSVPNKHIVVREQFVMVQIKDTATFLIRDGMTIIVSPHVSGDEDNIRLYLLGSCIAILLMQRRILPLHGSAVAIEGKAYAFLGNSGAGKSTLSSTILSRGYPLLSDDVIALSLTAEKKPMVIPSYAQQKLWLESLDQLGMDYREYQSIYDKKHKFAVPVLSQYSAEPLPLAGIYILHITNNKGVEIYPIPKLERLQTLSNHTYCPFLISPLGLSDWQFQFIASMATHVDMHHLCRPDSRFTAHELADIILNQIEKEK